MGGGSARLERKEFKVLVTGMGVQNPPPPPSLKKALR